MTYQVDLREGSAPAASGSGSPSDPESVFDSESFLTDRRLVQLYPEIVTVLAHRGATLVARWLVPTATDGTLSRPFRLMPYTPISFRPAMHESERRSCLVAIATRLTAGDSGVAAVELPLAPRSASVAPFADAGIGIGYRQTYLVDLKGPWEQAFSPTCQNNIRRAGNAVSVAFEMAVGSFDCEAGITKESDAAWASRSLLVEQLLSTHRGLVATARRADGTTVGQGFIAWDHSTAYLLHNWRIPDAPRGTMNLVIAALMRQAGRQLGLSNFDLEGSVVPGVDRFYSTFGAAPVGYPWLSWSRAAGAAASH